MHFAFYGRVSTEDQQDPEASRAWQLARARALIESIGGEIVREYFDVGMSRSLPWRRRPHAARLLTALRDRGRGFDAVVIGEPQRAFYGNQFGLTFPLFEHYGVQLWVPEVGGAIDPGSDAHDLVMSLYGGMSKGERNRIKIRVRSAMAAQAATEGRFLGGRPPYGYRLADAGPHPNPSKALDGRRLHRLEPDPVTAPVVQRIFGQYLAGHGLFAIAEALTADGILSPSAHDRARNRHRRGVAWSKSAVRVVLTNPRYTGRQVWNKQRKDEVLIDVDDVALGHETKMRWNDQQAWIWSAEVVQEPLVTDEDFAKVQALLAGRRHRQSAVTTVKRTRHPYQLRGLLFCGLCQRRMQGSWNNDKPHYRCIYPTEYGLANHTTHPRSVYLREEQLVPALDRWLLRAFAPERLPGTLAALADAQDHGRDSELAARAAEARRVIADCDQRLARYRAALEAGTDPTLVAQWTAEVTVTRAAAQAQLRDAAGAKPSRMTTEEINAVVASLGNLLTVLRDADPADKAEIYRGLGLQLTYQPGANNVIAEAKPTAIMYEGSCRRGDLNPHAR
ncbi:recombinase family protein [Dactylosporangium sp. NPDC049140]|uniref:recombinase family protein n=1 Tax=Dactylosporangium sp. NPDC049140 TaxID=3155647 RepID=UPI0033C4E0E4